jgi:hypothetical protein
MSTYDDWKTTDPSDADYCGNGHYHCPPCPVDKGTRRAHPSCECDHDGPDLEPLTDTEAA